MLRQCNVRRWSSALVLGAVLVAITSCTAMTTNGAPVNASTTAQTASGTTDPAASGGTGPAPLNEARAHVIEDGLTTDDPTEAVAVLAPAVATTYRHSPGRFWPSGTTLVVDWQHFRAVSDRLATVPATASGTAPGRWTILLQKSSGEWTVLATQQAK